MTPRVELDTGIGIDGDYDSGIGHLNRGVDSVALTKVLELNLAETSRNEPVSKSVMSYDDTMASTETSSGVVHFDVFDDETNDDFDDASLPTSESDFFDFSNVRKIGSGPIPFHRSASMPLGRPLTYTEQQNLQVRRDGLNYNLLKYKCKRSFLVRLITYTQR